MRLPDDSHGTGGTSDPVPVTPPPDLGLPTPPPDPGSAAAQPVLACDECGAPVEAEQRYCVVCGAHRRNVNDPATRYLSQASARSRRSKSDTTARRASPFSGSRGVLALALVIALIPVAAVVGVLAGRSSNNDDSHLIQALKQRQSVAAQTTTVQANAAAGSATTAGSSAHSNNITQASAKSKSSKASKGSKAGSKGSKGSKAGSSAGKTPSSSNPTAPGKISSAPSAAQKQQGANVTQKVQKSTGKNFVNGQNGLPNQVVVP